VFNEHVKRCVVSLDCFLFGEFSGRLSVTNFLRKREREKEEEQALQN